MDPRRVDALVKHWLPFFTQMGPAHCATIASLYDNTLGFLGTPNATLVTRALAKAGMLDGTWPTRICKDLGVPGYAQLFPVAFVEPRGWTPNDMAVLKTLLVDKGTRSMSVTALEERWLPVFNLLTAGECASLVAAKRLSVIGTPLPSLIIRALQGQEFVSIREAQWDNMVSVFMDVGRQDIVTMILGNAPAAASSVPAAVSSAPAAPAAGPIRPKIPDHYVSPSSYSHVIPEAEMCDICDDGPKVIMPECEHSLCVPCYRNMAETDKCFTCRETPAYYTFLRRDYPKK